MAARYPAAPLALLTVVACGLRDVPGPSGVEQVVVQGVLNAQATEQVLWIERTTPAGEPIGSGLRPLSTPPSRIEVRDALGAVFSFQRDAGNAARFVATFTPAPGRYDLVIEAGEVVLRATTEVPGPLTILDPTTDTVRISRDSGLTLRWTMSASWAAIYLGGSFPVFVGRDSTFQFSRDDFFAGTQAIAVFGMDSITARVINPFALELGGPTFVLAGNVTGGAGFFGALSSDQVVVQRQ
jgi:hypothetical protein